ncbi:MAG: hypothetical protein HYV27_15735 [Candidatus Hydrogenedentes bacterium]|nr:hypothetical protein [Candidatus Hydrogenedentota bacterium]
MKASAKWKKHKGKLWASVGSEFERSVINYLRLLWPTLVRVPARGARDQMGIDLQAIASGRLECVVQCKGFEVESIGPEQIRQMVNSIEKFRASNVRCNSYVLIYNRDSRSKAMREKLEPLLEEIVADGQAQTALLWSLDDLRLKMGEAIEDRLKKRLQENAAELQRRHESLFQFSECIVEDVPAQETILRFARDKPCTREEEPPTDRFNICAIRTGWERIRWTIVTGIFGSGKTTMVLNLAVKGFAGTPLYIWAPNLTPNAFSGTNSLLVDVTQSLGAFSDFDETERRIFEDLAGPVLGVALANENLSHLIVIDGLDENRVFADLIGMQRLSNALSDFRCPIVLTARSEYLMSMFGNFEIAFSEFSAKNAPERPARLVTLCNWKIPQVCEYLQGVEYVLGEAASQIVQELRLRILSGNLAPYGDLVRHPLFLSFIVEDIVEHGIRKIGRTGLISSWIERKLRRDLSITGRPKVDPALDANAMIVKLNRVMREVAWAMCSRVAHRIGLDESIDEQEIEKIATRVFSVGRISLMPLLLHTLMAPLGYRSSSDRSFRIGFALRPVHEYLIAEYLLEEKLSCTDFPDEVTRFYREMAEPPQVSDAEVD